MGATPRIVTAFGTAALCGLGAVAAQPPLPAPAQAAPAARPVEPPKAGAPPAGKRVVEILPSVIVVPAVPAVRLAPAAAVVRDQIKDAVKKEAVKKEEVRKDAPVTTFQVLGRAAKGVRAAAVAIDGANVDALVQQYTPQFLPMMRAELHLLRAVAKPTKEQDAALKAEAEGVLKSAVTEYAREQQRMMQGQWRASDQRVDPVSALHDSLVALAERKLTPEQARAYRQETDRRRTLRKTVGVENLVAMLDEKLLLSVDQRDKLRDALAKHWQEGWSQNIERLQYGSDMLPDIPADYIKPLLSDTQKGVWDGMRRYSGVVYGFFGGMMTENQELAEGDL